MASVEDPATTKDANQNEVKTADIKNGDAEKKTATEADSKSISTKKADDKKLFERFKGNGVNFRAKLIGYAPIDVIRGDGPCMKVMAELKQKALQTKGHKPKVIINVSYSGLKISDNLTHKPQFEHPVEQISFISRDKLDDRAFGYILNPSETEHMFYAIKTTSQADNVVYTIWELFKHIMADRATNSKASEPKPDAETVAAAAVSGQKSDTGVQSAAKSGTPAAAAVTLAAPTADMPSTTGDNDKGANDLPPPGSAPATVGGSGALPTAEEEAKFNSLIDLDNMTIQERRMSEMKVDFEDEFNRLVEVRRTQGQAAAAAAVAAKTTGATALSTGAPAVTSPSDPWGIGQLDVKPNTAASSISFQHTATPFPQNDPFFTPQSSATANTPFGLPPPAASSTGAGATPVRNDPFASPAIAGPGNQLPKPTSTLAVVPETTSGQTTPSANIFDTDPFFSPTTTVAPPFQSAAAAAPVAHNLFSPPAAAVPVGSSSATAAALSTSNSNPFLPSSAPSNTINDPNDPFAAFRDLETSSSASATSPNPLFATGSATNPFPGTLLSPTPIAPNNPFAESNAASNSSATTTAGLGNKVGSDPFFDLDPLAEKQKEKFALVAKEDDSKKTLQDLAKQKALSSEGAPVGAVAASPFAQSTTNNGF